MASQGEWGSRGESPPLWVRANLGGCFNQMQGRDETQCRTHMQNQCSTHAGPMQDSGWHASQGFRAKTLNHNAPLSETRSSMQTAPTGTSPKTDRCVSSFYALHVQALLYQKFTAECLPHIALPFTAECLPHIALPFTAEYLPHSACRAVCALDPRGLGHGRARQRVRLRRPAL